RARRSRDGVPQGGPHRSVAGSQHSPCAGPRRERRGRCSPRPRRAPLPSRSDGDRPPEDSYRWYRDHGYAFVAVTDHNQLTPPESYRELERPGFVILHGEEVTMAVQGHPVHMNALCTKKVIGDVPDHALEKF